MSDLRVSLYGAGKVAWNLGKWFKRSGVQVEYVYNRNHQKAEELAGIIGAEPTQNLKKLMKTDLLLLVVSDDAIKEVASQLPQGRAVVAHTSGNASLNALFPIENRGVFYPLQTFSREIKVDIKKAPFLLEADNKETYNKLKTYASKLSPQTYSISSHQRRRIHVAAVFANNFVNHMYKNAWDICNEHDIPFEVLMPLIEQTAEKVHEANPIHTQTGPAVREDERTIKAHLEMLEGEQRALYEMITNSIKNSLKSEE